MIEINLLPEELRKKEPKFKRIDLSGFDLKNIPVFKIVIISLSTLAVFHILLFTTGVFSKARLKSLTKKYNDILPKKKEADALKAQSIAINSKVRTIDELMVKRFSWAKELNALSDSMTPGIWLSEFNYDEKIGEKPASPRAVINSKGKREVSRPAIEKVLLRYLIISGYASSMGEEGTALIGKFIKSLKDNSNFYSHFSDIELGSIKSERIENQEVMSFKITCLFKDSEL